MFPHVNCLQILQSIVHQSKGFFLFQVSYMGLHGAAPSNYSRVNSTDRTLHEMHGYGRCQWYGWFQIWGVGIFGVLEGCVTGGMAGRRCIINIQVNRLDSLGHVDAKALMHRWVGSEAHPHCERGACSFSLRMHTSRLYSSSINAGSWMDWREYRLCLVSHPR